MKISKVISFIVMSSCFIYLVLSPMLTPVGYTTTAFILMIVSAGIFLYKNPILDKILGLMDNGK